MPARYALALVLALVLAACSKGPEASKKDAGATSLLISPEDLVTLRNSALTSGPAVTGSIQPERKADLRAEIQSIVLSVARENGDVVHRGDLLVRLDDTAIRDALASSESASRSAALAFEQAERQHERMKTLRGSGMASAQALDDAEGRRNAAQSDVEAAKARVVLARQQMTRTEVRAPFDGVVSERKVSAGDTATLGKELLKVIDPTSMRFEAMISADHVGAVKPGQAVHFRVNGYGDEDFIGKVRRVNPSANATTRQVEMLVDFVGDKQPRLAGLYAEGRLETETHSSLTIPATAIVRDGDKTSAWRVKDNKISKVPLTVGDKDARTGEFALTAGLAEGDQVIRYPTRMLKEGQTVQASAAAKSSMVATDRATELR